MQPNIIIADDHSIVRKGMKFILQSILGYNTITEVSTCNELMNEAVKKRCTHLLLDVIFPDGTSLEVIPNIKQLIPNIRIVIFSMQLPEVYSEAFRQYGVTNYLSKSISEEDTIAYLKKFLNNETALPVTGNMPSKNNPFATLTPRELEILHYVLNGQKTKMISHTLNVGMSTISTLKKRIFEKTETDNLKQLLELALLYNINF